MGIRIAEQRQLGQVLDARVGIHTLGYAKALWILLMNEWAYMFRLMLEWHLSRRQNIFLDYRISRCSMAVNV